MEGISVFPIGIVEAKTGLTKRQIRYYEQMGLLKPARTKGNQRRYSEKDVKRLLRIKELLKQGFDIKGIKAKLSEETQETSGEPEDIIVEKEILNKLNDPIVGNRKITSLYPVSNRAALVEVLSEKVKEDTPE
ncbi:MAG: MerR family transcriptional regulator [Firmicutes bacterium]|nr:MerR family transcriptional regulator [Bacillota bacterium]